jgi:hypothetical protein
LVHSLILKMDTICSLEMSGSLHVTWDYNLKEQSSIILVLNRLHLCISSV